MQRNPRVSVVMSVFNGQRYLRAAVNSILHQTFTDFEFIIIDDGSTDETWQILTNYDDPRIRLLRNDQNIGLTRSLNRGLALAQGQYIARMDADDISLPDRLRSQIDRMTRDSQLGLLGSAYEVISLHGRPIHTVNLPPEDGEIRAQLRSGNPFCHGATVFRRACLRVVGHYREQFEAAQDYDLWLRIAERFDVANLQDRLYQWRLTPGAITLEDTERQLRFVRLARDLARARSNGQLARAAEWELPSVGRREVALSHLSICFLLYAAGMPELARKRFAAAVSTDPTLLGDLGALSHWATSRTESAAETLGSYHHGAEQVSALLAYLTEMAVLPRRTLRQLLSRVYMTAASESYRSGELQVTGRLALRGICLGSRWLTSKRILSILWESSMNSRAADAVRNTLRGFR